ncbi:eCIS core domain-containing protein [Burkholderia singularis]|uniref:eCIS core domain-containing protein n=1 Tax=Burkholderia singularis TaxID=1503053 RepID=A0A238H8D5_9BURK|nr:DUF4157 domain-containing protein [Burkholderia singularis]SMG01538.1 hypothetical protein BSIN_4418 [Burkholderia singularis]
MSARYRVGAPKTAPRAHPARLAPPRIPRAAGRALDAATRAYMEPRFGQDFSRVRVHTDARSVRACGAHALTAGDHIAFSPGRYAPDTPAGRGLVAHELAHVVQQRRGRGDAHRPSIPGDRDETGAQRAVHDLAAGRAPSLDAARAGIHYQQAGDAPPPALPLAAPQPFGPFAPKQSASERLLDGFLKQMWLAQSGGQQPLRLTPNVVDGLRLILGTQTLPVSASQTFATADALYAQVRAWLMPGAAPAATLPNVLDRLVAAEKPLSSAGARGAPAGKPAAPPFASPPPAFAPQPASIPDPRKPPAPGNRYDEAATKALEAAFETFRRTQIGRELEKAVKEYVFSQEGVPLVVWVTAAGAMFIAANDPKLPAMPDLDLGRGITLKFDLAAKASELPPLLRELVHGRARPSAPNAHADAPGAPNPPERHIGASVTFTSEALGEFLHAAGRFFSETATWIGSGVVHAGMVIGRGASAAGKWLGRVLTPALFGAAGAAAGAALGALALGGRGALIGAAAGLAAGIGAGLLKQHLERAQHRQQGQT